MFKVQSWVRLALWIIAFSLAAGCKTDEDTDLPYILLEGDNPYYIDSIGGGFAEPGYTSVDDFDGDITERVVVTYPQILGDSIRSYDVVYTVSDKAGNVFSTIRKVIVRNAAWNLEGYYGRSMQICDTLTDTLFAAVVLASPVVNDQFVIRNFGNTGDFMDVNASVDRNSGKIIIPVPQLLGDSSTLDYVNPDSSYFTVVNDTLRFQVAYQRSLNGVSYGCTTYYRK